MKQRQIKFRVWDSAAKRMGNAFTIHEATDKGWAFHKDAIFLQYTGLKDKNSKEIYEGDLVQEQEILWQIYFGGNTFDGKRSIGWCTKVVGRNRSYFMELDTKNMVVVGNIYENPELIK